MKISHKEAFASAEASFFMCEREKGSHRAKREKEIEHSAQSTPFFSFSLREAKMHIRGRFFLLVVKR